MFLVRFCFSRYFEQPSDHWLISDFVSFVKCLRLFKFGRVCLIPAVEIHGSQSWKSVGRILSFCLWNRFICRIFSSFWGSRAIGVFFLYLSFQNSMKFFLQTYYIICHYSWRINIKAFIFLFVFSTNWSQYSNQFFTINWAY